MCYTEDLINKELCMTILVEIFLETTEHYSLNPCHIFIKYDKTPKPITRAVKEKSTQKELPLWSNVHLFQNSIQLSTVGTSQDSTYQPHHSTISCGWVLGLDPAGMEHKPSERYAKSYLMAIQGDLRFFSKSRSWFLKNGSVAKKLIHRGSQL
jgi:hypothetical protein